MKMDVDFITKIQKSAKRPKTLQMEMELRQHMLVAPAWVPELLFCCFIQMYLNCVFSFKELIFSLEHILSMWYFPNSFCYIADS